MVNGMASILITIFSAVKEHCKEIATKQGFG
jgi:hypothetical protein